jgi:hypothetical protein
MKTEQIARAASCIIFIDLYITLPNKPIDILAKPLYPGVKWSTLRSVHPTATSSWLCFAAMQDSWWRHVSPPFLSWTPTEFQGPNPKIVHRWFWAQTTKSRETYPLPLFHDLNECHHPSSITRSPSPPMPSLDLVNMIYSSKCTLACQPPTVILPTILVPRSKPHVYSSPLLVHRYDTSLLDLLHVRQ